MATFTALDTVRKAGIIIASDGAEYHKIGKYNPTDATTNPSLVYAAVSTPEYSHLVENAVVYAQNRIPLGLVEERTELALDRLLVQVGAEILAIIPGRVSISVDPRLGSSSNLILSKSRALISLVDELNIPRSRILIKIPATQQGIHAAHVLETQDKIHTNLTLIFSLSQALACAQAGVSVISPFIGRVKDWWAARAGGDPNGLAGQPLSEHPGIQLVRRIREAYTLYGYTQTQIMSAGFRKPEEIIELSKTGRRGGRATDLVTLPPELLEGLMNIAGDPPLELHSEEGSTSSSTPTDLPTTAPVYFATQGPTAECTAAFARDSREEAIALDKVPEGLAKFSVDAVKLENRVRELVEKAQLQYSAQQDLGQSPTGVTNGRVNSEAPLRIRVAVN